jgi:sialic acid synthase SpsE
MTHFISEVSSNHASDLERCFKFIDTSADIGCDSVKFQLFKIEDLFSHEAITAKPEIALRKAWELPLEFLPELKNRCTEKSIQFGCTPFYLGAVDELVEHVDYLKIASYELLWHDLIQKCAETGLPIIISTGMADISEIEAAINIIMKYGSSAPTVLHCNSSYPSKSEDVNLSCIQTIRDATGCTVGWSDHSVSKSILFRAINKWNASHIEFHLDLDGKGEEFSTGHCWLPDDIKQVIDFTREIEVIDGNGIKQHSVSEVIEKEWRADPSDGLRPLKHTRLEIAK